ncbi:hypothetical protein [Haloferula sargassicola]|uniref:Uncharacterized protein n=1 Tax=Haloferula sargassicola TaxID=490096 RepID=A0ABP9UV49_9BACT
MDATTGLLLVFCPAWVLAALKIEGVSPESLVFLRWIGVFVGSVGLSYGWALRGAGETVWKFTALVRTLVAAFVTVSIVDGSLVPAWAGVAATDAVVAVVQMVGLRKRWWR